MKIILPALIMMSLAASAAQAQTRPLWSDLDRKNWSTLYDQYGQEWLDHVNALGPDAVKMLAAKPGCDRIYWADYSQIRSSPPREAVFLADCENKRRVYVTEREILEQRAYEKMPPAQRGVKAVFKALTGLMMAALYFFPTIIAGRRNHVNKAAITALNFFLGWTGLGWIIAFIWALTADTRPRQTA